jgi:hypothetical protein
MQTQEFRVGDKVRFRTGGGICTPNYPVIPMKVTAVKQLPDGTTQVKYDLAWYYNGFNGETDSKWLELEPGGTTR